MRLHGIEVPVVDLDRAYSFYSEVLEFPVIGRFNGDRAMFFLSDVHGGMVTLVKTSAPPDGRGVVLVLSADGDIEGTRARLEARGTVFLGPTRASRMGRSAEFVDSEGNTLALFEAAAADRFRETAGLSNSEVRARVDALETRLFAVLEDVRGDQAAFRAAPGEWPILGQLGHIVDTLDSCGLVAHDLANGRQPPRDRMLEKEYPLESLETARTELGRAFDEARRWVGDLPETVHSRAKLAHGVFGELGAREWVAFMLFHVGMHVGQIEEIKTKPGYPGS